MTTTVLERPDVIEPIAEPVELALPVREKSLQIKKSDEPDVWELPGIFDPHVHLREPGATHKEDFVSGTKAALAAGVIALADMPNNPSEDPDNPFKNRTLTHGNLAEKYLRAEGSVFCDIGFYQEYHPEVDNLGNLQHMLPMSLGTKFYVEPTFGNKKQWQPSDFREAASRLHQYNPNKPIIAHVEEDTAEEMMQLVAVELEHPFHLPHANTRYLVETALRLRAEKGADISVGICPHHLFMTEDDVAELGWFGRMKPALAAQEDQDFLWAALEHPAVFMETDHAPHTPAEKQRAESENPDGNPEGVTCYGVPGLDSFLPLMLQAVHQGRLSRQLLTDLTLNRPAERFGYHIDPRTKVHVAMQQYTFGEADIRSKCGWSPFVGRTVMGRVVQVELHGQLAYSNSEFLTRSVFRGGHMPEKAGFGQVFTRV